MNADNSPRVSEVAELVRPIAYTWVGYMPLCIYLKCMPQMLDLLMTSECIDRRHLWYSLLVPTAWPSLQFANNVITMRWKMESMDELYI